MTKQQIRQLPRERNEDLDKKILKILIDEVKDYDTVLVYVSKKKR